MTSRRKRFRLTGPLGGLARGEREVLEVLVALQREFPEAACVSADAVEALMGARAPGTLAYLTMHGFLYRTRGSDGAPAYVVTVSGFQKSREALTGGVRVPRWP